jgi:hypothetical protein
MKILHTGFALMMLSVVSHAQESTPERPRFSSPDNKWEFRFDSEGNPEIVRTGTTETILQLYDKCGPGLGDCKPLLWASDSTRFALNAPDQGRYQPTSFYQVNGDKWEELPSPDAIGDVLDKAIAAQVKKRAYPRKSSYG